MHIANALLSVLMVPLFLIVQDDVRSDQAPAPCGSARYCPAGGYVPDEATAIHVAEPILKSIYGNDLIDGERPFAAQLQGETWIVRGTLHCPDGAKCLGGVAEIWISKQTGQVLKVIHGE